MNSSGPDRHRQAQTVVRGHKKERKEHTEHVSAREARQQAIGQSSDLGGHSAVLKMKGFEEGLPANRHENLVKAIVHVTALEF